jgi:hypothetical protein
MLGLDAEHDIKKSNPIPADTQNLLLAHSYSEKL